MGGAVLKLLEHTCDDRQFRKSSNAILARKVMASYNSNELWSCVRSLRDAGLTEPDEATQKLKEAAQGNASPKSGGDTSASSTALVVSYEDFFPHAGLQEYQLLQLWDVFSRPTKEGDVCLLNEILTAMAVFCGARLDEKTRFLLCVFDGSHRGLLNVQEILQLVNNVLTVVAKAVGVGMKPKLVKESFIDSLTEDTAIGRTFAITPEDTRWAKRFISLEEMEGFTKPLQKIYESLPFASHPAAKEMRRPPTAQKRTPHGQTKTGFFKKIEDDADGEKQKPKEKQPDVKEPSVVEQPEEVTEKEPFLKATKDEGIQWEKVEHKWVPLCVTMDISQMRNIRRFQMVVSGALGAALQRVHVIQVDTQHQCIGENKDSEGVALIFFAVGGPMNINDTRTANELAVLLCHQISLPHSYLHSSLPSIKLAYNPMQSAKDSALALLEERHEALEKYIRDLEKLVHTVSQQDGAKSEQVRELEDQVSMLMPRQRSPDAISVLTATLSLGLDTPRDLDAAGLGPVVGYTLLSPHSPGFTASAELSSEVRDGDEDTADLLLEREVGSASQITDEEEREVMMTPSMDERKEDDVSQSLVSVARDRTGSPREIESREFLTPASTDAKGGFLAKEIEEFETVQPYFSRPIEKKEVVEVEVQTEAYMVGLSALSASFASFGSDWQDDRTDTPTARTIRSEESVSLSGDSAALVEAMKIIVSGLHE